MLEGGESIFQQTLEGGESISNLRKSSAPILITKCDSWKKFQLLKGNRINIVFFFSDLNSRRDKNTLSNVLNL